MSDNKKLEEEIYLLKKQINSILKLLNEKNSMNLTVDSITVNSNIATNLGDGLDTTTLLLKGVSVDYEVKINHGIIYEANSI